MAIQPQQKSSSLYKFIALALLLLLALGIYSNSFHGEFVFVDLEFIANNNYVKSFANIRGFWIEGFPKTRATVLYSFALNYQLNGLNVFGFHVFNFIVHIIAVLCVFWLIRLILSTPVASHYPAARDKFLFAFCVAALFCVHPIQTQAVTYITQRFASMAAMFYIATLCFYLKGRLTENNILIRLLFFIGGLITMALAMTSKEIAITIPLMFLLLEYFFFRHKDIPETPKEAAEQRPSKNKKASSKKAKTAKKASVEQKAKNNAGVYAGIIAFVVLVLIAYNIIWPGKISSMLFAHRISESHDGDIFTFATYFFTQTRVWAVFIYLLFFPFNQNLDYDFPMSTSFFEPLVLLSTAFIIALFVTGLKTKRKFPLVSFGIFWFFLTLSVNFIPRANAIFEHKLYLVSTGFYIALTALLYTFIKNKKNFIIVLSIIVCMFSVLTYKRNNIWRTELSVWHDVLRNSPNKGRPNQNLGKVYIRMGQYDTAIKHLDKALEANEEDYRAYTNRGVAYYHKNILDQALSDLNNAIRLKPRFYGAYSNRGLVYQKMGEFDKALADFNSSLTIKPNFYLGYSNRADLHSKMGNLDLAFKDFSMALKLEPRQTETYNRRAIIYFQKGMHDHALADFDRAISYNPNSSQTYANRGYLYLQKGTFDFALKDLNLAIKLNPRAIEAYNNRGSVFIKINKYDLAMHDFDRVLQMQPNHSSALYNVGAIHMLKEQYDQSIFHLNKSLAINPNYGPAYFLRANCYEKKGNLVSALEDLTKAKELGYPVNDVMIESLKQRIENMELRG